MAKQHKTVTRKRKSTTTKHQSLQNIVKKLNDSSNPQYRDRLFENPSAFFQGEMGIRLSRGHQKELRQAIDYLQGQSPAPVFYIPGLPPQELPEGAIGFI